MAFSLLTAITSLVGSFRHKPAQRESTSIVPPRRAKMGMGTKKIKRSLVFGDESEPEFGVAFPGVVQGPIGQIPVSLGTPMGSFNGGARAGDGFSRGNELSAATFDFGNAPFDFSRPSLLDFTAFKEACNQPVREPRPLLGSELERLGFHYIKLV